MSPGVSSSEAVHVTRENATLEGRPARSERFEAPIIQSALVRLARRRALPARPVPRGPSSTREAAVQIAEAADHPLSMSPWLRSTSASLHLRRRAISRVRPGSSSDASTSAEHGSSSDRTPDVAAALGVAYALARPWLIEALLRWVGRVPSRNSAVARVINNRARHHSSVRGDDLPLGRRIDEAANHAREASRRLPGPRRARKRGPRPLPRR